MSPTFLLQVQKVPHFCNGDTLNKARSHVGQTHWLSTKQVSSLPITWDNFLLQIANSRSTVQTHSTKSLPYEKGSSILNKLNYMSPSILDSWIQQAPHFCYCRTVYKARVANLRRTEKKILAHEK